MNINWDAKGYKENFSFVHEYGEDVVSLLKSPKGAAVLDLGCGNGALSVKLLEWMHQRQCLKLQKHNIRI